MKTILLLFTMLTSALAYSQRDSIAIITPLNAIARTGNLTERDTLKNFWGIPLGCSQTELLEKLKTKGLTSEVKKTSATGARVIIKDFVFARRTYFLAKFSIINNKLYEVALYYTTEQPHIIDDFNDIKEEIDAKYFVGESYSHYKYPYEKGDGHEESAISMGYGELSAYWVFAQNAISLQTEKVTSSNYIRLVYQHSRLIKEAKVESTRESDY